MADSQDRNKSNSDDVPALKDLIFRKGDDDYSSGAAYDVLFDWIDIPQGAVTMVSNGKGYLPRGIQLDVMATAFTITRFPVTNQQYAPYVNETGQAPEYWKNPKFNRPLQPVVGVSWFDVLDYCTWLSTKLPFEVVPPVDYQWQRAAQGDTDYKYPWGNRWMQSFANTNEVIGQTTPVHQYPVAQSPYGVYDLAGNVWEWCYIDPAILDEQEESSATTVLCGGSWLNYDMFATVHSRNIRLANMPYNDVGFRIVRYSDEPAILP